jgi:protein-disulfide isomerase
VLIRNEKWLSRFAGVVLGLGLSFGAWAEAPSASVVKDKLMDIPAEDVITEKLGNGKAKLYYFTDFYYMPTRFLESRLEELTDVTIIRIPLDYRGGVSRDIATGIWCSKDKLAALRRFVHEDDWQDGNCETPFARNEKLAEELGVKGVPTLILSNGLRQEGVGFSFDVQEWIAQNQQ